MAKFINQKLKSLKSAYKDRENQLAEAAHAYKTRLESVVRRHEELLCAYRDLRSQVEGGEHLADDEVDLGPEEHELVMADSDLQSSQQKEIIRLQAEIHKAKSLINKQVMRLILYCLISVSLFMRSSSPFLCADICGDKIQWNCLIIA